MNGTLTATLSLRAYLPCACVPLSRFIHHKGVSLLFRGFPVQKEKWEGLFKYLAQSKHGREVFRESISCPHRDDTLRVRTLINVL